MEKKLGSILEELDNIIPTKDKDLVLEARAIHAISNAIHILRQINEHYSDDDADVLTKSFILAVKNNNVRKFENRVRHIKESKNENPK